MQLTTLYLGLGSNHGQRHLFLEAAKKKIHQRIGAISALSHIYETPPWGFEADQSFLNQVVACQTSLSPTEALDIALEIERQLGRTRLKTHGYSSRTMDIDLLLFGNLVLDTKRLVLPHPHLHTRRFVLEPLVELAPNLIHPVLLTPLYKLLDVCEDESLIAPWPSHTDI